MACYPWQQSLWQQYQYAFTTDQIPQALLIYGNRGTGKQHFAKQQAQLLLCLHPQSASACGSCTSCQLFAVGNHSDFFYCDAESDRLKVTTIRELLQQIAQTPKVSQRQVVIIDADALTIAASNALLKTLEEPSGDVLFILLSTALHHVLPTVRSRCQLMAMPMPKQSEACAWLAEQLPDVDLTKILSLDHYGPLALLALATTDADVLHNTWIEDLTRLTQQPDDSLGIANDWLADKTCEWIPTIFTLSLDLYKLKVVGDKAPLTHAAMKKSLIEWAKMSELADLQQFLAKIIEINHLINQKANINLQLLLEDLLFHWPAKVADYAE